MGEIHSLWSVVSRHKIIVAIAVAALLVGIVDENSLWQRRYRRKHIAELREQIRLRRAQYARDSVALYKLEHDPDEVIRIAREDYYMLHDDEDIFVVETDTATAHEQAQ